MQPPSLSSIRNLTGAVRGFLRSADLQSASDFDYKSKLRAFQAFRSADQHSFERDNTRKLFRCLNECHVGCVLREPEKAAIVRDALLFFEGERYELGDFVVMPNHVHLLIAPWVEWER